MTLTTLVIGPSAAAREAAIAAAIKTVGQPGATIALILEGLPTGMTRLDDVITHSPTTDVARIAPGCVCCTGNLTMRVTLNRMLRRHPARLYISLATPAHLDRIRSFLTQAPYDDFLTLTQELQA